MRSRARRQTALLGLVGTERPGLIERTPMSEVSETPSSTSRVTIPRVLITGAARGAGVSTIVLGILAALKKRGMTSAVGKVGTHLALTSHYRRITGTLAHSLDLWMLDRQQIRDTVARLASGAELLVIEGSSGLFDQNPSDYAHPNEAELANDILTPVVLVVNAAGYGESIRALVEGFAAHHPKLKLAGVICNRVQSAEQEQRLRAALAPLREIVYLGSVLESEELPSDLDGEGEGTQQNLLARSAVVAVGSLIERSLNLDALRKLGESASPYEVRRSVVTSNPRLCRIAIADDMAFHLTYQSNLDLLRREGAELVAFSPLVDRKLPSNISGVYLPGGFVHHYASELSANAQMHRALRDFVAQGGALYAEGNAVGFLCSTAQLSTGTSLQMVGLVPGAATLVAERPLRGPAAYVEARSLMPTAISDSNDRFRGMRAYQWAIRLANQIENPFELMFRPSGKHDEVQGLIEGFVPSPRVVITSVQPHWTSNARIARLLVETAVASGLGKDSGGS